MLSTNGHVQSPSQPPITHPAATKRKWEHYSDKSELVSSSELTNNYRHCKNRDIREFLADVITVLTRHDTFPSILNSPFNDVPNGRKIQGNSNKRAKFSTPPESSNILTKFKSGGYTAMDDFTSDITLVADGLLAKVASEDVLPPEDEMHNELTSHAEKDQLVMGVMAFKKLLSNVLHVEKGRRLILCPSGGNGEENEMSKDSPSLLNDGDCKEQLFEEKPSSVDGRNVLTLFGTAGGHKQLFSSLQKLKTVPVTSRRPKSSLEVENSAVRVPMPLHDERLPLGISRSRLVPVEMSEIASQKKPTTKMIDHFAPPANLMQLNPPKTPYYAMNRISSISWSHRDCKPESTRAPWSSTENLTAGLWLGYSGKIPAQEPTSPEAKRKQRDRALSTGEVYPKLSEGAIAAQLQAREDAVFRSAYSTFAPNSDDSAAIVPVQTRNQVWWQKVGRERFESACLTDPLLLRDDTQLEMEDDSPLSCLDEEEAFKEVADHFDPDELDLNFSLKSAPIDEKDVKEQLKEISNLLETLHSYQRGRNSSLAPNSRSAFGQTNPLQDLLGSPTNPSAAEVGAYRILQSRVFRMLYRLPPYAVAKLNGLQLADLHISRKMITEERSYRGVMEEDQVSRLTKAAALSAAAGSAMTGRASASGIIPHQTSSMQYTVRNTSTPQNSRLNGYGQHTYPTQAPFPRSGSNYSRNSLSNWQAPPSTNNPIQRPYGQPTYVQQTPKTSQPQYRPNSDSYSQRPPTGQSSNISFQSPNSYLPQSHSPYQNRAQTAQMFSPVRQPNSLRSESPQKPLDPSQMTSLGIASSRSNSQIILEHDSQQDVIERQRAQLTQQTHARTAAQNNVDQRVSVGAQDSPGSLSPQANGTTS